LGPVQGDSVDGGGGADGQFGVPVTAEIKHEYIK
jgi:hypothetical protein